MSPREIADRIDTAPHPSLTEAGPVPSGAARIVAGRLEWSPAALTRLELPTGPGGIGNRWVDYDTADEARDARDRARRVVMEARDEPEAWLAMATFYANE